MKGSSGCVICLFQDRVEITIPEMKRFFRKHLPSKTVTFEWREVTRVMAFKRDQYIVDCVCCAFDLNSAETVELNEDMQGWQALVDAIPHNLLGALTQEEWWQKVAFPAFEACPTEIYRRAPEP